MASASKEQAEQQEEWPYAEQRDHYVDNARCGAPRKSRQDQRLTKIDKTNANSTRPFTTWLQLSGTFRANLPRRRDGTNEAAKGGP